VITAEPSRFGEIPSPGRAGTVTSYRLRPLGETDLAAVHALHDLAHELVEQPGQIARETPEFFREHIAAAGRMYGIDVDGRLIGYCVLGLPHGRDYNFGLDVGLPDARLDHVAHLDGAVVHPDWQGLGLQRAMVAWRIERAQAFGREVVISTAAPRNHRSWHTLMLNQLRAVALRRKFGGHWRYLLLRDLVFPITLDEARGETCAVDDIERQQALLAAGWVGIARAAEPPDLRILFAAPVS
jgi:GNAT superfamily N-acetyltransferase